MTIEFAIFWVITFTVTLTTVFYMTKKHNEKLYKKKLILIISIVSFIILVASGLLIEGVTQYLFKIRTPELCKDYLQLCKYANYWDEYSFLLAFILPILLSIFIVKKYAVKYAKAS